MINREINENCFSNISTEEEILNLNKRENNNKLENNEKIIYELASYYRGSYLPKKVVYKNQESNKYKFSCENNHKFNLTIEEINNKKWCVICCSKFNKLKEIIENKKGTLLTNCPFTKKLFLKCKYNHIFKIKLNNLNDIKWNWCAECNMKKENLNKKIEKQEEIIKNLNKNNSEPKFGSSQLNTSNMTINEKLAYNYCNGEFLKSIGIGSSIENKSLMLSNCLSISQQQTLLLNYIIKLDIKLVKQYLYCFDPNFRKDLFRRCCLLLHPDKNPHPASKDAFVKLISFFNNK